MALLAASALYPGLWAQFAPLSFFTSFPGGGLHWVSMDGPYNEHLVRDVGGLYLALAVVSSAAAVLSTTALIRVAAGAWLLFAVPHLIYHVTADHPLGLGRELNFAGIGLQVLSAVVLMTGRAKRKHDSVRRRSRFPGTPSA